MARLSHKLKQKHFTVTAEIDPPKGSDVQNTLAKVRKFADKVDAVNVADCPMANVRMSPITLAHLIQRDAGVEAIFHLTCRDRNVIGLQAELLGAAGLGVRNILALTGDTPQRGDHPGAQGVFELDVMNLIKLASTLNTGKVVSGGKLAKGTDFAIGCVANPGAEDLEKEVSRLEQKTESGASFVQTQPIFDPDLFYRWLRKIEGRIKVPILYGILPLSDYNFASHLNRDIPGINVPQWAVERLRTGGPKEGSRLVFDLLSEIKPYMAGVHIFPMNRPSRVIDVLEVLDGLNLLEREPKTSQYSQGGVRQ